MNLDEFIKPLCDAGFALHWLHPRAKRPIGENWSEAPVHSYADLRASYRAGYNVGVRLGEVSRVGGGYLHTFDIDIRFPDLADEAWEAFEELFPDVDVQALPCVQSGSGGESRHLYFITEKPFRSKRLAVSAGKHRNTKGGWSYDWEIELFGTGKQVALPPSIHPDTGKPYCWLHEFDLDMLEYGIGPYIAAADIERLAVVEHTVYEFETREPLTFANGQLERTLDGIAVSDLHYDDWIRLGQAIHHQYGGSNEGFELWLQHTRRSTKFTGDKQIREMRRVKWKSFGRYRGKPVTMATVVEWAKEAHIADLRNQFDEEDEDGGPDVPARLEQVVPAVAERDPIDDIGGDDPAPAAVDDIDDLLGGETEDAPAELDDIDSIGTASAPLAAPSALDWISLLDITEEGGIKGTLHNIELIVKNDSRLVGLPQLNQFTQETVQRTPPGAKIGRRNAAKQTRQLSGRMWEVKDTLNGELWSDDRDFAMRSVIEAPKTQGGYGMKISDRDLKAAVVLSANEHAFHPVREYLSNLTWDGTARVEGLFTDYVGAPDDAYSRSVSRLMMVGAVSRIFEPGHKFDFAVILEGLQGKRKSTFIKVLGRSWFAELDGDFHDPKQMVEMMQGAWIMEIPELSGFGRADVRSIKAFISRQKDRARLAYARRAGEFPRQCIFIGSTNDREYLKDDTGGRRFWPMMCSVSEIDTAALERVVDQMWAEAVIIYQAMRAAQPHGDLPLYLADEAARDQAARLQESRRVETSDDAVAGRIAEWLAQPVQTGSIDDDTDDAGNQIYRTETCLIEIWTDCLAGDARSFKTTESAALGRAMKLVSGWTSDGSQRRFPKWGKQRVYVLGE